MKQYDAIVIGFGKGGKTLAGEIASHGWQVAMVEKSDKMYGGTCINIGCIPTKALIEQAEQGKLKGLTSREEQLRAYRQAMEKKNQLTGALRQANFKLLDDRENVTVYNGEASFLSPTVVRVRPFCQIFPARQTTHMCMTAPAFWRWNGCRNIWLL